jgi:hypothetical protein
MLAPPNWAPIATPKGQDMENETGWYEYIKGFFSFEVLSGHRTELHGCKREAIPALNRVCKPLFFVF